MTDLFNETCPCCGQSITQEQPSAPFEAFWTKVPHKIGKEAARKAWGKLAAQDRALASDRVGSFYAWFKRTYKDAAPLHPSTYLNGKRWQDEALAPTTVNSADRAAMIAKMKASPIDAIRERARRMEATQ